jgi:hypothetical protein
MSARPFVRHGQRIASGPVHDMHSPWWTIGVGGAVLLAVGAVVTVATWIAWGFGLPVGERKR